MAKRYKITKDGTDTIVSEEALSALGNSSFLMGCTIEEIADVTGIVATVGTEPPAPVTEPVGIASVEMPVKTVFLTTDQNHLLEYMSGYVIDHDLELVDKLSLRTVGYRDTDSGLDVLVQPKNGKVTIHGKPWNERRFLLASNVATSLRIVTQGSGPPGNTTELYKSSKARSEKRIKKAKEEAAKKETTATAKEHVAQASSPPTSEVQVDELMEAFFTDPPPPADRAVAACWMASIEPIKKTKDIDQLQDWAKPVILESGLGLVALVRSFEEHPFNLINRYDNVFVSDADRMGPCHTAGARGSGSRRFGFAMPANGTHHILQILQQNGREVARRCWLLDGQKLSEISEAEYYKVYPKGLRVV